MFAPFFLQATAEALLYLAKEQSLIVQSLFAPVSAGTNTPLHSQTSISKASWTKSEKAQNHKLEKHLPLSSL